MTDPPTSVQPDSDGEVPQRFLDLIDQALADQGELVPPRALDGRRARSAAPKRVAVYAAVAAVALVVALVGLAAIQNSGTTPVDIERAAIPTSPATSDFPQEVAGDGHAPQIAADAEIAAGFGLTLGPQVFADDGSFDVEAQPDLTPVFDGEVLVGYARRADLADDDATRLLVYAPDGVTVRGVLDERTGFTDAVPPTEEGD